MTSLVLLLLLSGDVAAAEQALANGEPQKAIELLGDLAGAEDAPVAALAVLGRAYLQLGNPEAAIDPLLRASDRAPEDRALARDAAVACYGNARGQFARAYLEDARRYAERSGDALLLADIHYALGNLEEALAGYRGVESPPEQRLRVLANIADCLERLDRAEEAQSAQVDVLEEALRRDDIGTAFKAAFAAGKGGRLLQWLDERIAKAPELKYLWYRGHARDRLLLYEGAAEDFREVLRLQPGQAEAKTMLVTILLQQGMREQRQELLLEAERLAKEILDDDPRRVDAFNRLFDLASYLWQNREVERTHAILRYLHEIDPTDHAAATNYANLARRLGHYDEAEAVYLQLLEEDPTDIIALGDYGILQDGRGDGEAAIALWQRVLDEDPWDLNALENLFTKAWERGDAAARDEYLRRGLDAAGKRGDAGLLGRWRWFEDRLLWAPAGFGG